MPIANILAELAILAFAPAVSDVDGHYRAAVASHARDVVCHRQETTANTKDIRISGTLVRRMTYGPPYFGERPKTDSRYPYWVVKLDYPITVTTGADIGVSENVITVQEMQIQFGSRMGDVNPAFRGKHVIVHGNIHTQVLEPDMTPVVIDASSMAAGGPIPCEGWQAERRRCRAAKTVSASGQSAKGSASSAFFSYVSYEFAPHVTWVSPDAIAIDIPKVDEIYTKLDQMNGIRIHYTIGRTGK
jgi:hypothetical protein